MTVLMPVFIFRKQNGTTNERMVISVTVRLTSIRPPDVSRSYSTVAIFSTHLSMWILNYIPPCLDTPKHHFVLQRHNNLRENILDIRSNTTSVVAKKYLCYWKIVALDFKCFKEMQKACTSTIMTKVWLLIQKLGAKCRPLKKRMRSSGRQLIAQAQTPTEVA